MLRFAQWREENWVNHAFTTRVGGVSQKEFAAMNLGFRRGDDDGKVAENYRLFCAAAGFDPESLVCGAQDHHVNIRRVTAENRGTGIWREKDMESIDGLCTDDPAVTLVIYCADCVPLYFLDPAHRAIGLAHAGWRGTRRRYGPGRWWSAWAKSSAPAPRTCWWRWGPPSGRSALRWTPLWERSS